jgi:hypothetical protein
MEHETKQYLDFEEGFGRPGGGPFNILDIKIAGGVGRRHRGRRAARPAARSLQGGTDLDFYTSGGEDWYSLPQRLNSITYREHQVEGEYHWWLLGDGTEWTFLAAYPEVVPL